MRFNRKSIFIRLCEFPSKEITILDIWSVLSNWYHSKIYLLKSAFEPKESYPSSCGHQDVCRRQVLTPADIYLLVIWSKTKKGSSVSFMVGLQTSKSLSQLSILCRRIEGRDTYSRACEVGRRIVRYGGAVVVELRLPLGKLFNCL